jgi:hypothetical protein
MSHQVVERVTPKTWGGHLMKELCLENGDEGENAKFRKLVSSL